MVQDSDTVGSTESLSSFCWFVGNVYRISLLEAFGKVKITVCWGKKAKYFTKKAMESNYPPIKNKIKFFKKRWGGISERRDEDTYNHNMRKVYFSKGRLPCLLP